MECLAGASAALHSSARQGMCKVRAALAALLHDAELDYCLGGTVDSLTYDMHVWECRSHLAQAHIHQAGATAASALGQAIAGVPLYTWLFCGMIVLSRVAFWVYDMVDAQIFQTVSVVQALYLTAYFAASGL